MGPVVVVAGDEFIDEVLEFFQGVGWWLLPEPFLHGLLESLDFAAGGGVSGR